VRALIVDDSKPVRSILTTALRSLRFDCQEAGDGAEALALLDRGGRTDLVTVNWHMPVMDGLELIRSLRSSPRHRGCKLLMISTENEQHRIAMAIDAGADVVKTHTGFGAGHVRVHDVRLLKRAAAGQVAVEAAGGVTRFKKVHALMEAGAARVAVDCPLDILQDFYKWEAA